MVAGPARPATFDAIDGFDLTPLILEMASSLHNWGESSQLYKQLPKDWYFGSSRAGSPTYRHLFGLKAGDL